MRCREKVGAVFQGLFEHGAAAPLADEVVVTVGKDFGDERAAEVGGAGVLGVVEQAAGAVGGAGQAIEGFGVSRGVWSAEAFEAVGVGVAEDAGQEPDDGVNDDGRSQLTAGEDVVADRKLAVAEEGVDALVDSLVPAADEDDALECG